MEKIDNILIVDDSGTARMIIRQCLEIAGFSRKRFYEARNGQEALEVLETEQIDLLLTDLNMPVMDGITLLKNICTLAARPIIMVITSASNKAREEELAVLGANYILTKPISPAGILRAWNS